MGAVVSAGSDLEARSRLTSILDICEHESHRLELLEDPRLDGALEAMRALRAEIVAALAALGPVGSQN